MTELKLNLGCGAKRFPGYVNVDKYGEPDLKHDLEEFPWPWPDNSVAEVMLVHVLEHLGQRTETYLKIIQELYRVCRGGAKIVIVVPHFRHDHFFDDPTHVRAITPLGLRLFSQRENRQWIEQGAANSPLGLYLNVNFELLETQATPSPIWSQMHAGQQVEVPQLQLESSLYNNLIEQWQMTLEVIK